ncbi:hypothetical protein IMG5_076490, partial [Ichthyophthirius multifiliis]
LKSGRSLEKFLNLQTLIMDQNELYTLHEFPKLEFLEFFSATKNNFAVLDDFLIQCQNKFPNLINLNLFKNPLCPPFYQHQENYHIYRQQVVKALTKIKILDGIPVSNKDFQPFQGDVIAKQENINAFQQQVKKPVIKQQYIDDNEEAKGVVEYNEKYTKVNANRNILKGTSQGNKHIPNDKL